MSIQDSRELRKEQIKAGKVIYHDSGEAPGEEERDPFTEELKAASSGNGTNGDNKPAHFKPGHPLTWYARQPIDHTQTLLGNRYLCRGGGMFAVAPSGMGKSTFSIQLAILWCCGLVAFGIKPHKALRILIVQSEDDEGDCTEMAQMVDLLKLNAEPLTAEQKVAVNEQSELIRCNDLVGYRFIEALRERLTQARTDGKPFDLVIINPFTVFLGADPKDADACTKFLNERLNPILSEFAIGAILIHHTPKTNFRDTTDWRPSDWMYSGAGAAVMTNWARAYLVIDPCDVHGVYKFIAAKRGKRIGWGDHVPVFETFWAHSQEEGQLLWLPATADQIALAKPAAKKTPDDVLTLIPLLDPSPLGQIQFEASQKWGLGMHKVREFVNVLVHQGKIFKHEFPRPRTNPEIKFSRTPPSED
jgi:AAA domain